MTYSRDQIEEMLIEEMAPLTQQVEALTALVTAQQEQINELLASPEAQSKQTEKGAIALYLRTPEPPAQLTLD